jgi:hypothetical protein
MAIAKSDVLEAEIAEVPRLASDGYSVYLAAVPLISTTSVSNIVVITLVDDQDLTWPSGDHPVESGDRVQFYGTGSADGYFTIDAVLNGTTFTTVEPINSSTGGFVNFIWPAGAGQVGFDPTKSINITSTNVQGAISDLDKNLINPAEHETLRQLIHFIDEGPADGFVSGAYKVISPPGIMFPTSVIWYVDDTMAKKIVEQDIVWSNIVPTTITWKVYNTDGVTIAHTVSDNITYENFIFETTRTRSIS